MTDIVDRLRNAAIHGLDPSPFDTLSHEAADEIERLRAEISTLLLRLDGFDIMGLSDAQHRLPGPFGGSGTPNAAMKGST